MGGMGGGEETYYMLWVPYPDGRGARPGAREGRGEPPPPSCPSRVRTMAIPLPVLVSLQQHLA